MKRRVMFWVTLAAGLACLMISPAPGAWAQAVTQTPIAGSSIPQWMEPLPTLALGGGTMENVVLPGAATTSLYMREFVANILPTTAPFVLPGGVTYAGTHVFGYRTADTSATQDTYIGPVFVPERGTPTEVNYVNKLGDTTNSNVLFWRSSVDQTLHWADPNMNMGALTVYEGPIPAVPHLHGGEVPAAIDGGPDAWFLSDPAGWNPTTPGAWDSYMKQGDGYYTRNATDPGYTAVYRYPNGQEAGPLWFHDHLLGGTRLNVYAGLAGAYLLIDPTLLLPTGMNAVGLNNGTLDLSGAIPNGANTELTVPLVIQDRMFDTNGELYFPNTGLVGNTNIHPFWIPEFVGDTIVVNGKSWPYLNVAAKRYRFLIINGSNARAYEMFLVNPVTKAMGPPIWVIGTDGGYLDTPVKIDPNVKPNDKLIMMPGERYQVIIDFGGIQAGTRLILRNTGRTPYPKGTPPTGSTLGQILQFRVGAAPATDPSYDPATLAPIRTGGQKIVRLVNPPGTPNVTATKTRQLTLNEVMGPGGPLEILVNNTKWNGYRVKSAGTGVETISTISSTTGKIDRVGNYITELPAEGTVEQWEIINLTADAHPIHTHLTQFQILNRQNFNVNNYMKRYNATFPQWYDPVQQKQVGPGSFVPAFGPPADYFTGLDANGVSVTTFLGGNPDVTPYLQGMPSPSLPQEAGWKDTAIMYPGQVTRILVRYAPNGTALADANPYFDFEPNRDNYDYVWHCHIVDHEDNEMMRPYQVDSSVVPASFTRGYSQGSAY